eukprot:7347884-Prymnesium_polylepis.1
MELELRYGSAGRRTGGGAANATSLDSNGAWCVDASVRTRAHSRQVAVPTVQHAVVISCVCT